MKTPALLLLAIGASLPSASQQSSTPTVYNIELVIFRAATALGAAENWSAEGAGTSTGGGGGGGGGETNSSGGQLGHIVSTMPASQQQLSAIENRLRATGVYVPMAHVAWSQTASAWGNHTGIPVAELGLDVPGLSGTVTLERGQYLHLGLNLSYLMPNPPAGIGAGAGTTFTLNENRRIKFYERNYYDHPAFGVIALVTPAQGARPAGR